MADQIVLFEARYPAARVHTHHSIAVTEAASIADHLNGGILSPGICPIRPKTCSIQINSTTNTTILSKLLIAPAIGI